MNTENYWKVAEMLAAFLRDGATDEDLLKEVRLSLFIEYDKEKVHGRPTADTERLLHLTADLPTSRHFRDTAQMVTRPATVPVLERVSEKGGPL